MEILRELFGTSTLNRGSYSDFYLDNRVEIKIVSCKKGVYVIFDTWYPGYQDVIFESRFLTAKEAEMLYPMTEKVVGTVKDLLN